MKLFRIVLCASALLGSAAPTLAFAQNEHSHGVSIEAHESHGAERVRERRRPSLGQPHLLSTNRWSEMFLTNSAVYLQMTDDGIKEIGNDHDAETKDEGFLGHMVKAMALSGVKQLLDHSLELPLVDVRAASVRGGQVILVACDGKEVFDNVKVNGEVQTYPQDKAEDFVKMINRQRKSLPACK